MKETKGITLIALIITIIIMLILAGVVISIMISGGIFTQANSALLETRGAAAEEESNLWKMEMKSNKYAKEIVMTAEEKIQELIDRKILTLEEQENLITDNKYNGESVTIGKHVVDFNIEISEDEKVIPNPEDIGIEIAGVPTNWTNQDANIIVTYTGDITSLTKEIINVNGQKEYEDSFIASHNGTITVKLNHSSWSEPKIESVEITKIDKFAPFSLRAPVITQVGSRYQIDYQPYDFESGIFRIRINFLNYLISSASAYEYHPDLSGPITLNLPHPDHETTGTIWAIDYAGNECIPYRFTLPPLN